MAVSELTVVPLISFLACAYNGLGSRWVIGARIRVQVTRGVVFFLLARVVRLIKDEAFLKLFEDLFSALTRALLVSTRM